MREEQLGTQTSPDLAVTPEALYERMCLIRRVEERIIAEYASRRIRMPVHLSIGQESVAVGVLVGSRPTDTVIGTHRSHAVYLAKGGDLQAMIDEFYSLNTGCSRGAGGSMHLASPDVGLLGSTAVLGGGVPIAVGTAFGHRHAGRGDVAFALVGDGATDEGSFWESLNLAAVLRLPVLFVVENNGYSTLSPLDARQASPDVVAKSEAFGVPAASLDGDDVVALNRAVSAAVGRVRGGDGPQLLEALTFRYVAHVGVVSDFGVGRPSHLAEQWPSRDPLQRFEQAGVAPPDRLAAIRAEVDERVDHAFGRSIRRFEEVNAVAQLAAPPPPNPSRV
jgi:TPP-dependent pyruvate/acetoin dehydrogenase alpha subunit